jgi:hypothetical protein
VLVLCQLCPLCQCCADGISCCPCHIREQHTLTHAPPSGPCLPQVHPGQVESSDTTGLSPEMEGVPVEMRPAGQSSG